MAEMTPDQMGDNARLWAEQFYATFPDCGLDWGTMAGWFANCIETASDKRVRAAVEAERERCAKVAAEMPRGRLPNMANDQERALRNRIAAAIRARGKEQNPA